jgi:hypothetical protein
MSTSTYPVSVAGIAHLLELARDLNTPGEVNAEYVSGQVGLICEASGLALAGDLIGDRVRAYITHQPSAYLVTILTVVEQARWLERS